MCAVCSTELSLQVPPNVRIANITGLKPDTSYKVSVIAVFKSEKKIQHHPEVYITTASSNETEGGCYIDFLW